MKITKNEYFCDLCMKKQRSDSNLDTEVVLHRTLQCQSWKQFHVQIDRNHGVYNDGTREKAQLCKKCACKMFREAISGVTHGRDKNRRPVKITPKDELYFG